MSSQLWKKNADHFITASQVIADFAAVVLSFWIGFYVYVTYFGGVSPLKPIQYQWVAVFAGALYISIFKALDLYRREISLLNVEELRKICIATAWSSLFFFSITFYVRSVTLSRVTVTISMMTSLVILYIERTLFYKIHLAFHLKGLSQKKILIYGAGEVGRHILKRIYQSPALGMSPVGLLDDDPEKVGHTISFREYPHVVGNSVLGSFKDLENLVRAHDVEEVIVAIPSGSYQATHSIIKECQRIPVQFAIVPHSYELLIEKIHVSEIGGIPILRVRNVGRPWYFAAAKRLVDLFGASLLLLVFSPFYALFGILIKLDSRGPIIFKQKRVGLRGKEFSFYKFRTMHVSAPQYANTPTTSDDPRITRVGKWLRRSSLDELPQLFNVLRGEMSLVGPRPEMPFIVAQYSALQKERLVVKPGITGVWQISAVRGDPIHKNIEYDLYYIEHQSLLLDFVILLKTVFGVVRGIGAV